MSENYKVLGQVLTGQKALDNTTVKDTIVYTVPAGKQASVSAIEVTNSDTQSKSYSLSFVKSEDVSSSTLSVPYTTVEPRYRFYGYAYESSFTGKPSIYMYSEDGITFTLSENYGFGYGVAPVKVGNYLVNGYNTSSNNIIAVSTDGFSVSNSITPKESQYSDIVKTLSFNNKLIIIKSIRNYTSGYWTNGNSEYVPGKWNYSIKIDEYNSDLSNLTLESTRTIPGVMFLNALVQNNKIHMFVDYGVDRSEYGDNLSVYQTASSSDLNSWMYQSFGYGRVFDIYDYKNKFILKVNNSSYYIVNNIEDRDLTFIGSDSYFSTLGVNSPRVNSVNNNIIVGAGWGQQILFSNNDGLTYTLYSVPNYFYGSHAQKWGYIEGKYVGMFWANGFSVTTTDFITYTLVNTARAGYVWNDGYTIQLGTKNVIRQDVVPFSMNKQKAIYNKQILPGESHEIKGGVTLSAGDQIRIYSQSNAIIANIYGVELS